MTILPEELLAIVAAPIYAARGCSAETAISEANALISAAALRVPRCRRCGRSDEHRDAAHGYTKARDVAAGGGGRQAGPSGG